MKRRIAREAERDETGKNDEEEEYNNTRAMQASTKKNKKPPSYIRYQGRSFTRRLGLGKSDRNPIVSIFIIRSLTTKTTKKKQSKTYRHTQKERETPKKHRRELINTP